MNSISLSQPGWLKKSGVFLLFFVVATMDPALCDLQRLNGGITLSRIVSQEVRAFSGQRLIEPPDGYCFHAYAHPGYLCTADASVSLDGIDFVADLGISDTENGQPVGSGRVSCRGGLLGHICCICQHVTGIPG